jgi:DeoR/GlpR family transcriptional regulator of sugar metabolism
MIGAARRTIVVADATKFGQRAFAHICPLANVDILVTDREPPRDLADALANAHVHLRETLRYFSFLCLSLG